MYFLCSGKVRLIRRIPFIYQDNLSKYFPYNESIKLKKFQRIEDQMIDYSTLVPGDFFPEIPNAEQLIQMPHSQKTDLIAYLSYNEPRGLVRSFGAAECIGPCVILEISRLDFAKLAPSQVIANVIQDSDKCKMPIRDIQKQWIVRREWQEFKSRMMIQSQESRYFEKQRINDNLKTYAAKWTK
jgi:hypothetical protein